MMLTDLTEKIKKEIIDNGYDDRYKVGAYEFVLNGVTFYTTTIGQRRLVSGRELSKGLLMFAQKQYGPMAQSVFDYWGLKSTDDLGYVVYNMMSVGLMNRQTWDTLDDFTNAEDMRGYFREAGRECFEIDKSFIKNKK